jgi:hypothetical protein
MRYIILYILLSINLQLFSQVRKTDGILFDYLLSGYIGISSGLSIPVSDYASTEYTKYAASYAITGSLYRIQAGYEFLPFLGLRLAYINLKNGVNTKALQEDMNEYQTFSPFVSGNSEVTALSADNYEMNGVQLGLFYPFRMSKTTIEVFAEAGLTNTVFPEFRFTVLNTQTNDQFNFLTTSAKANQIAFSGGLLFRHKLYKNILLLGGGEFTYSEQEYTDRRFVFQQFGIAFSIIDYTQFYQMINLHVGLAYQFE